MLLADARDMPGESAEKGMLLAICFRGIRGLCEKGTQMCLPKHASRYARALTLGYPSSVVVFFAMAQEQKFIK